MKICIFKHLKVSLIKEQIKTFNIVLFFYRDVKKSYGSLCSLAFMYLALTDTIRSKSEMKNMSYDTMKDAIIGEIMKINNLNSSTYDYYQPDVNHLKMYKQGIF